MNDALLIFAGIGIIVTTLLAVLGLIGVIGAVMMVIDGKKDESE